MVFSHFHLIICVKKMRPITSDLVKMRDKAKPKIKLSEEQEKKILEEFKLQMEVVKNGIPLKYSPNDRYDFVMKKRMLTADQMKREFNLSDEEVKKIMEHQTNK